MHLIGASNIHEPNDIFHSSSSERENEMSVNVGHGKKRSSSGATSGIERGCNVSNLSDDPLGTSHKRAKSDNGKTISSSKENHASPPLPGDISYSLF